MSTYFRTGPYCAAKDEHYYGLKAHMMIDNQNIITFVTLTASNIDEREVLIDALTLLFYGRDLGILSNTETPNAYAFLGASNLADIIIPDRYKEIYLLADNDRAGMKSIELLQNNSSLKGRTDVKIEIFKTNSHKDLNALWLSKLKEKPERGKTSELKNVILEKR